MKQKTLEKSIGLHALFSVVILTLLFAAVIFSKIAWQLIFFFFLVALIVHSLVFVRLMNRFYKEVGNLFTISLLYTYQAVAVVIIFTIAYLILGGGKEVSLFLASLVGIVMVFIIPFFYRWKGKRRGR